jgi:hypothetical protein
MLFSITHPLYIIFAISNFEFVCNITRVQCLGVEASKNFLFLYLHLQLR